MQEQNFEETIRDAVSEALAELGESVDKAIRFYLERNYKVGVDDIPDRTDRFVDGLQGLLSSGAIPLESIIIHKLSAKVSVDIAIDVQGQGDRLVEVVQRASRTWSHPEREQGPGV
ncbi:MAG TPA: hypothetical protein VEJ36_06640 [Nitrososphaerales archaeon]|nr:hypothetical protein [Nitrososphaerales archaeon]